MGVIVFLMGLSSKSPSVHTLTKTVPIMKSVILDRHMDGQWTRGVLEMFRTCLGCLVRWILLTKTFLTGTPQVLLTWAGCSMVHRHTMEMCQSLILEVLLIFSGDRSVELWYLGRGWYGTNVLWCDIIQSRSMWLARHISLHSIQWYLHQLWLHYQDTPNETTQQWPFCASNCQS